MSDYLLEVKNLDVVYQKKTGFLGKNINKFYAVKDVSFYLKKGEILGLVGESGCGKSSLSRSLMALKEIYSGEVFFKGKSKISKNGGRIETKGIQMIFQDSYASLNPRLKIYNIIEEAVKYSTKVVKPNLKSRVFELGDLVGLGSSFYSKYPHELSGGQRQRVGIARALAFKPDILIADEPVSALDVSIQAKILNLLKDLQNQLNLSMIFISHDISVVSYLADRIMVMNDSKIVETEKTLILIKKPKNIYTKYLLRSVPKLA